MNELAAPSTLARAQADFALTRQLGVTSYPSLLFIDERGVQPLPATGTSLDALNQRLDALLA